MLNRTVSNGRKTLKEMLSILSDQGNENQNNSDITSKTLMTAYAREDVDKGEDSSIAGESANLYSCWWKLVCQFLR